MLAVVPGRASPQVIVEIDDQIGCEECNVDLQLMVTLSPDESTFTSLPGTSIARGKNGHYLAGPVVAEMVLATFDPGGRFRTLFGRVGEGPGEFAGYPHEMHVRAGAGDDLFVFHNGIRYVVRPDATVVLKQDALRVHVNDAVLVGNSTVTQATVYSPRGATTPLQVFSSEGTLEGGIGIRPDRPFNQSSSPFERVRRLAPGNDGRSVWSAYVNRYEISRFGLSGSEELRVIRRGDWFPPYDNVIRGETFIIPQRPRMEGLLEDSVGLLWVLISHAADDTEPIGSLESALGELRVSNHIDMSRFVATTVEVLDLVRGTVVARQTFDSSLRFVSDARGEVLLYSLRLHESGELAAEVFSALLGGR